MKDPTKRFSDRVENYIKYRPTYPLELVTVLKMEGIVTENSVIADIGSGTGIFTKLLLESGFTVYGVEPNDEMRVVAEKLLKSYPTFHSVNGRSEATSLEDDSIDVITVAQAFHWFDFEKTRIEFLRILKSEGNLVLVWNDRLVDEIPFQRDYDQLLQQFCPEYHKPGSQAVSRETLEQFYGHTNFKIFQCGNKQSFNYEGLKGRLESSSYCLKNDDPNYPHLMSSLRELYDKYQTNNSIAIEYVTRMYYGKILSE